MPKLIVMVGISGSGKTTYAKRMKKENTYITSADEIRKELYGDENIQGSGKQVFQILFDRIDLLFAAGYDVIVDNTNTSVEARKPLLDIAKKYDAGTIAILFECSVDEAVANQKNRERKVPRGIIQKQFNKLEMSRASLFDEFDFVVVKHDKEFILHV